MGMTDQAIALFQAGLSTADPYVAVTQALSKEDVTGWPAIAFGKAAVPMMRAAVAARADAKIVVTNPENAKDIAQARVFAAAHPVPDSVGLEAALAVEAELGHGTGPMLVLVSGGGSALLPAPVHPMSLADKQEFNAVLLAAGLDIEKMNLVRQAVSRLKGGGMLRAANGRHLKVLILSDVVGDDLRAIASGPTVAPLGTRAEASALLQAHGLWEDLPNATKSVLSSPGFATCHSSVENTLIGSNALARAKMAQAAPGAEVHELVGDVSDAAARVVAKGRADATTLFGGETTVHLKGSGTGGRNQELALRVALLAEQTEWGPYVYLQAGTDGRDGPTDAAGAIVDETTLPKMRAAGFDPLDVLDRNDSYPALKAAGALYITGGTGTNVADLGVLIRR